MIFALTLIYTLASGAQVVPPAVTLFETKEQCQTFAEAIVLQYAQALDLPLEGTTAATACTPVTFFGYSGDPGQPAGL